LLQEILGILAFRFNKKKIRVWSFFNWGRNGPLIIGRNFGYFRV